MKKERGSFPTLFNPTTIVLDDTTLNPDRIFFWIDGANSMHGYDNGTTAFCEYNTSNMDNSYSLRLQNGGTTLLQGKVTNFDTGEIEITFATRTNQAVNFIVIED